MNNIILVLHIRLILASINVRGAVRPVSIHKFGLKSIHKLQSAKTGKKTVPTEVAPNLICAGVLNVKL